MRKRGTALAAFLLALGMAGIAAQDASAQGQSLKGAGSTFVAPVMARWIKHFAAVAPTQIDYQAVGSGAGIEAIEAGKADFGATDKPLDPAELAKYGLCQFPIVIGGIVPVVNLPGISPGQIRFSGRVLANIFMGKVTRWNDADIAGDNPYLSLPDLPITVIYRSDKSGTTYNWTSFLAQSNPDWKTRFGMVLLMNLPLGVSRAGNAGVSAAVQETEGSIGYVEYAYALQHLLTYGTVANAFRIFVQPGSDSFRLAASAVDWRRHPDFSVLMTNAPGPGAYPIAATTFILMPKAPKDTARSAAAIAFFKWALESGGTDAADLQYVSLPPDVVAQVEDYWNRQIKSAPVKAPLARKPVVRQR